MNETGIVLADHQSIVREGIAALFLAKPQFRIVGECSDGFAARQLILSLKPMIAVIELEMPKLHGIEVIRGIRETDCPVKIIVLSTNRDLQMVEQAFRTGADGYVLKQGPARHLLDAINFIRDGGQYLTPLLGREVADSRRPPPSDRFSLLSSRERQVFGFLVDGVRPKDIAMLLNVSPKTVDTYRSNIMRKLEIDNIVGLVKFAINRNLSSAQAAQSQPFPLPSLLSQIPSGPLGLSKYHKSRITVR